MVVKYVMLSPWVVLGRSSSWTCLTFMRFLKRANRAPINLVWCTALIEGVFNKVNAPALIWLESGNFEKKTFYEKLFLSEADEVG